MPAVARFVPVGLVAILLSQLIDDVLAGVSIVVLWAIWKLLYAKGEPPVLPLALSFQWMQVTCGLFYYGLTGRELEAIYASDYRPMVAIGLGCVCALTIGLALGSKWASCRVRESRTSDRLTLKWRQLLVVYGAVTSSSFLIRAVAWSFPAITQGLLALSYARLGILFLILRRLTNPRMRWGWYLGLLACEVGLGLTGYFASFREPLIIGMLALIEASDWRSLAHWGRLGALVAAMVALGVLWIGIRGAYRADWDQSQFASSRTERLGKIGSLSSEWFGADVERMTDDLDRLVDRLWVIYYPALAVSRVPSILPHTDGRIMLGALTHIVTPRILFPGKGALSSNSEMVRTYSGVYVAGPEQGTSIAFGYAAEAYVDFGLPWMFVPSVLFGVFMGVAYRMALRGLHSRELAAGFVTVVFWISLFLFERSWVRTLGISVTLLISIGALAFIADRFLRSSERRPLPALARTRRARMSAVP